MERTSNNRKRRKSRRKRKSYLREFGFEILIVVLVLVGGFLLVERTDVSAVITGWLRSASKAIVGGIAAIASQGFEFFSSIETSDIVGYFLILLAIHLLILRGRRRLLKDYDTVYTCPYCENDKIQRVKRQFRHKVLGTALLLRVKNYRCNACNKETITFSRLK